MGVVVSSPSPLSPFSVTSGVFGFIGFAFTLATFLKVVWQNLETVVEAPAEVHEYLTTLRQELLEEKRSVRLMRQRCHKRRKWRNRHEDDYRKAGIDDGLGSFRGLELDDVSLKTTQDLVRRLIREFKDIEHPFLAEGEDGIMGEKRHQKHIKERERDRQRSRDRDRSPYYNHGAYHNNRNGRSRASSRGARDSRYPSADEEDDEDRYWVQRVQYANLTLPRRIKWIYLKPRARNMFNALTKIQIRRMSQQVAGIAILMHEQGVVSFDMDDRIRDMDDRLRLLVGVRRGDS